MACVMNVSWMVMKKGTDKEVLEILVDGRIMDVQEKSKISVREYS